MTVTAFPDTETAVDPLALLPISANLLPQEVIDLRRTRKVRTGVAAGLVVLLLVVIGWDIRTRNQTAAAQHSVNRLAQQNASLQKQAATFGPLQQIQAQSSALSAKLQTLTASDLPWYSLIPSLDGVASKFPNTQFASISGLITAGTATTPTANGQSSAATVGSLTLTGTAPDKNTIAAMVDALSRVPGVANPYLTGASQVKVGAFQFTVTLDITSAALGGRFAKPTTASGGK